MVVICIKKAPNLTLGRKYVATMVGQDHWTSFIGNLYTIKDDMGLESVFSEDYVREVEKMREDKLKVIGI